MNQNAIPNPLADLLAGRNLETMASTEIEALFAPLEVKTNDAAAAVTEAEARARAAVSNGAASIPVEDIAHARLLHEFCGVAQSTLAAALDIAREREAEGRKAVKVAEVSEYLDARNKAAIKLEKALADAGEAIKVIAASGEAAIRVCDSKVARAVMADFSQGNMQRIFEMELWRTSGGLWFSSRHPVGVAVPLSQRIANSGADLITEIEIRG
jgi:hypothetical protein